MAERKCQTEAGASAPVHPWYKERLHTKCLKDPVQRLQLSGALNGRRWRFLTAGLDDFRDGYPIPQAGTFTKPQPGTEAAIFGTHKPKPEKTSRRHFTKEQVCFSKQNCLRQTRRRFVDAVEQSLSRHPLALYSHLGSGMEPELFYDVLSVLDPALNVRIETPLSKQEEFGKEDVEQCEGLFQETLPEKTTESPDSLNFELDEVEKASWNPYKLKESKKIFAKKDQKIIKNSLHSTSLDDEINRVTKLFCDWVTSLGGETNDITESTILNLFASGCEKNPVLAFQDFGTNEQSKEVKAEQDFILSTVQANTPSKKSTYGAWYLNSNTWKKRPENEPLRDPSMTEDCEFEQQLTEKDEELKQIYGAQAFKQFIVSKGLRVPRFLRSLCLEEEQENKTRVTHATASTSTHSGSTMI